jgi:hypothetical protein
MHGSLAGWVRARRLCAPEPAPAPPPAPRRGLAAVLDGGASAVVLPRAFDCGALRSRPRPVRCEARGDAVALYVDGARARANGAFRLREAAARGGADGEATWHSPFASPLEAKLWALWR